MIRANKLYALTLFFPGVKTQGVMLLFKCFAHFKSTFATIKARKNNRKKSGMWIKGLIKINVKTLKFSEIDALAKYYV